MPIPLIWGAIILLGAVGGTAYVVGETLEDIGDAAEPIARAVNATTKLVVVSGVLAGSYLAYQAMTKK